MIFRNEGARTKLIPAKSLSGPFQDFGQGTMDRESEQLEPKNREQEYRMKSS